MKGRLGWYGQSKVAERSRRQRHDNFCDMALIRWSWIYSNVGLYCTFRISLWFAHGQDQRVDQSRPSPLIAVGPVQQWRHTAATTVQCSAERWWNAARRCTTAHFRCCWRHGFTVNKQSVIDDLAVLCSALIHSLQAALSVRWLGLHAMCCVLAQ